MRLIKKPILCNYYLTYRCNASCSFCDIWEKPSPYVSKENLISNLKELKKLGVKIIDFTGGEPLLHKELDTFLVEAKSMGFITTITTNCLLYPKFAEKLKSKVDMLHFSIDSYYEDKHNRSRGVKCYDKVLESIKVAKQLGESPDLIFTVSKDNLSEIGLIWEKISQPNNLILILNPIFDYKDIQKVDNFSHEDLKILRKWGKKQNVYLNDAFIQLRLDGGNNIENPVCRAASSTIVISPENNLILPCYHLGKHELPIENNLSKIYNSKSVKDIVSIEGRLPECQGCVINCYMQPSFAVDINKYFWKALPSTIKYNLIKGTWKEVFKNL